MAGGAKISVNSLKWAVKDFKSGKAFLEALDRRYSCGMAGEYALESMVQQCYILRHNFPNFVRAFSVPALHIVQKLMRM